MSFYSLLVDTVCVFFVVFYAGFNFKRGFFGELLELIGFSLSFLATLLLFPYLSFCLQLILIPVSFANTISFLLIWISTEIGFSLANKHIFKTLPMNLILSKFNRYLGIVPAIISCLLLLAFVGSLLTVLPTTSFVKTTITQSQIFGRLVSLVSPINHSLESAFSQSVRDSLIFLTKSGHDSPSFVKLKLPGNMILKEDYKAENELYLLLNQERSQRGLPKVTWNKILAGVAWQHSKDMFSRSYFGHLDPNGKDPLSRISKTPLTFSSLAENLAYAPDTLTAHAGLMASNAHRAAILSVKFTRVGIGVADSGFYGRMYTQFFAD